MEEEVRNVVTELLTRIDALAKKFGIVAEQVWAFTVKAKVVQAKRDILKAAAVLPLVLALFGWSLHVATMKLPHNVSTAIYGLGFQHQPLVSNGQIVGYGYINMTGTITTEDKGLSDAGIAYVISGFGCLLAGLIVGIRVAQSAIGAAARLKTAEYDAYQDILYDLKP